MTDEVYVYCNNCDKQVIIELTEYIFPPKCPECRKEIQYNDQ